MLSNQVFISYSRQDEKFALKLRNDLLKQGGNVWLDQHNIPNGASWDREIENALENASYVVIIVSEKSNKSENVRKEIAYAIGEKKPLLPIRIEKCKLILQLANFHCIDMIDDYDSGLARLLSTLQLDQPVTENKEELLWKKILAINTEAEYAFYLRSYPNGIYKREAIRALSKRYPIASERNGNVNTRESKIVDSHNRNFEEPISILRPTVAAEETKKPSPKIGQNDPCPCGSGKKYKNCHGRES